MTSPSIAGLIVLLSGCMLAAPPHGADGDAEASWIDRVRQEDERRVTHWDLFPRVRAGYPQSLSAGIGLIRSRLPETWECMTACPFRGVTLQLEPGIRGIQASAGFATLIAEKKHQERYLTDVHTAFGVKGVLLHRWDDSALDSAERTFVGIEFSYTVTRINFSLGTLRRLERVQGGDWIVAAGIGWGF